MKPTLEETIRLAVEAHYGQRDRAGEPYILHPLRVMFRLQTETEKIVGVLHDVIEDTKYTADDLRRIGYSEEILQALNCVTRRAGETYEEFVSRTKANPLATRVKLADLEDNMDVRRMVAVTEKDMERLARYRKAWSVLQHGTTGFAERENP